MQTILISYSIQIYLLFYNLFNFYEFKLNIFFLFYKYQVFSFNSKGNEKFFLKNKNYKNQ